MPVNEFKIRADFYNGQHDNRTKIRLEQVQQLGMTEVMTAEFGIKGVCSGLYIEKVWHLSEDEWFAYLAWVCEMKGGANKVLCPTCNGTKKWNCVAKVIDANGCHEAPGVLMDCPTCGATGEVDPVEMKRRKEENEAFWR